LSTARMPTIHLQGSLPQQPYIAPTDMEDHLAYYCSCASDPHRPLPPICNHHPPRLYPQIQRYRLVVMRGLTDDVDFLNTLPPNIWKLNRARPPLKPSVHYVFMVVEWVQPISPRGADWSWAATEQALSGPQSPWDCYIKAHYVKKVSPVVRRAYLSYIHQPVHLPPDRLGNVFDVGTHVALLEVTREAAATLIRDISCGAGPKEFVQSPKAGRVIWRDPSVLSMPLLPRRDTTSVSYAQPTPEGGLQSSRRKSRAHRAAVARPPATFAGSANLPNPPLLASQTAPATRPPIVQNVTSQTRPATTASEPLDHRTVRTTSAQDANPTPIGDQLPSLPVHTSTSMGLSMSPQALDPANTQMPDEALVDPAHPHQPQVMNTSGKLVCLANLAPGTVLRLVVGHSGKLKLLESLPPTADIAAPSSIDEGHKAQSQRMPSGATKHSLEPEVRAGKKAKHGCSTPVQ